ncbi:MAG: hypothetical protein CMJ83_00705, partial [Planctomycetes bacterium]|nr:hypothetical protein [Planctomycetota bacterium]
AGFARARERTDEIIARLPKSVRDSMGKSFRKLTGPDPTGFSVHVAKPFLVLVERDPSWDEALVASQTILAPLSGLEDLLQSRYPGLPSRPAAVRPLSVVMLRSRDAYRQYVFGRLGHTTVTQLAHTEPDQRRLIVHRDTKLKTIVHEGTHLLLEAWRSVRPEHHARPLWFEEGFADWIGGCTWRVSNNRKQLDVARVRPELVTAFSGPLFQANYLTLKQVLDATIATRDGWFSETDGSRRVQLAYAQGWALVHFLHWFDVDDAGFAKLPKPGSLPMGRHLPGFRRYLALQMQGRDGHAWGSRVAFQAAMGLDDAGLARMSQDYVSWLRFLSRKVAQKAVRDGQIVPWNAHTDARGEVAGEPEDDRLRE